MQQYILLLGLLIVILVSCAEEDTGIKPQISDITQSVYASGNVKAVGQYDVYSTTTGILKNIMVDEGDTVGRGDTLFVIDNKVSELNYDNANVALELSRENASATSERLQELKDNVDIAYERLMQDSMLHVRQAKLWEQRIGSKLELEQRKLAFENASAAYKSAVYRLQQFKQDAEASYQQAQNMASLNKKLLSDFTIVSEMDGRVYGINKEQGELVSPQTSLGVVGAADTFEIALQVDENDIVQIQQGQKVLVTMDSYNKQVFEASVTTVYPLLNERTRSFTVICQFTKGPPVLYPNLTVEANIIIDAKRNKVVIPRDYLIDGSYVLLKNNERAKIETGIIDYRYVEVLSGLDTSQMIYKAE